MIHELAISILAGIAVYFIATFHSAVVAKLKAETKLVELKTSNVAQLFEAGLKKLDTLAQRPIAFAKNIATDAEKDANAVVTDIKQDVSKL
jgi:hypothetical protein